MHYLEPTDWSQINSINSSNFDAMVDWQSDNYPEQIIKVLRMICKTQKILPFHLLRVAHNPKACNFLRGIAHEIDAGDRLKLILRDITQWDISRPDSDAQPNTPDRDIVITYVSLKKSLTCESKGTNTDSLHLNKKNGHLTATVKLHKSRIAMTRTEDRDKYRVGHCQLVVTNLYGAVVGWLKKYDSTSHDRMILIQLARYLNLTLTNDIAVDRVLILDAARDTFLFAVVGDLIKGEAGFLDSNPTIDMSMDDWFSMRRIWHPLHEIEPVLFDLINSAKTLELISES
jgi:hypothetical protein